MRALVVQIQGFSIPTITWMPKYALRHSGFTWPDCLSSK